MTEYLISVLVVAVSLTVAEFVIPSGRIKNTVQTALALVFISVMVKPIITFDFDNIFSDNFNYDKEVSITSYFDKTLENYYEKYYKDELLKADLVAEKVKVEISENKINIIEIYLSNLVIEENNEHINITVIRNYIAEKLNLNKEILFVYA